jgi:hypothetical protein
MKVSMEQLCSNLIKSSMEQLCCNLINFFVQLALVVHLENFKTDGFGLEDIQTFLKGFQEDMSDSRLVEVLEYLGVRTKFTRSMLVRLKTPA